MSYADSHILIIDEGKDSLKRHIAGLEAEGYSCHLASDHDGAMEILTSRTVDLALMDFVTPGIGDLRLFQSVKVVQPNVAVIFVTAVTDLQLVAEHFKNGASDIIFKPVDRKHLLETVKSSLERRKAALEAAEHLVHLEELVVTQARALQNRVREIYGLNRILQSELVRLSEPNLVANS